MKYVTKTVEVEAEIGLEDFDDDELVSELEGRGYEVSKIIPYAGGTEDSIVEEAAWRLSRGDFRDALELMARFLGPRFRALPDILRTNP